MRLDRHTSSHQVIRDSDLRPEPRIPVVSKTPGRWWSLGVFVLGLLFTLILYRDLWADPVHTTLGSVDHTNDPMQTMWFLKWVPWQVLHGHSPFTTTALFYPGGVSLAWNTLVPNLGILAAPLSLTAGPALSFAVLITLGPALTVLTGFWWLRRHVRRAWPAAAGGLLLGFDPYMSGHLLGHLNLVFACLLPIMLMLVEDLLWRRPRPQRRTALYLGVVTAVQLGISEELALILIVGAVVAVGFALVVRPASTRRAIRQVWGPALLATGVMLALASPLLISQLFLSPMVTVDTSRFRATPGDFVHGSYRQIFGTSVPSALGGAEHGAYLGWPMIVVLLVGVVLTWRRDPWVRVAAGSGVVLVVLCMFPLLGAVPALESVMPARYSFALYFVVAWLFARWLDKLAIGRVTLSSWPRIAASAVMAVASVSLTPAPVSSYPLPPAAPFFGSAWQQTHLPRDTAVLLLPAGDARGMYYQQWADFSFRQAGGYALLPPASSANSGPGKLLVQLSDQTRYGTVTDQAQLAAGRSALCSLSLRAILVLHSAAESSRLIALGTGLMRRGPDRDDGGVSVWLVTCP